MEMDTAEEGGQTVSHELHLLLNVAVAVAIALAGGLVAHRLGQSVIVGYLVAGTLIGPFTPGFVGDRDQIAALAEVGVIFLMFALGIEFSLAELARIRTLALVGTGLQVLLTVLAGLGLGLFLGWPTGQGVVFGAVIAVSSTMVILKTLLERGEVNATHGRVLLGMLIVQDLAVVILIVLVPAFAGGGALDLGQFALTVGKAALFTGATVFLGARVVPRILARVERLRSAELFLLTAVALALGSATVSALLGLSPALGAFLAGLLLTESEFDHRVVAEVIPMRDLFATLFFVSVGMLIDPGFILTHWPAVVGLATFIAVAKGLITLVVLLPFRLGRRTIALTSLGMIQIGEFSYVLARAGREAGALSDELHALILTSSILTIIATPAAFAVAPSLERLLDRVPWLHRRFATLPEPVATDGIAARHALVVGYGRVGRQVTAGLRAAGIPVTVIEEDLHLARELAAAGIPVIHGDAAHRTILDAAHVDRARLVVVALPDAGATRAIVQHARQAAPTVPILARVARGEDEDALRRAGATATVAPERAGALLLLEESARLLDLPAPRPPAVTAPTGQ
jgi:CPA2 family monovalent cation:H+ antiporter-2